MVQNPILANLGEERELTTMIGPAKNWAFPCLKICRLSMTMSPFSRKKLSASEHSPSSQQVDSDDIPFPWDDYKRKGVERLNSIIPFSIS